MSTPQLSPGTVVDGKFTIGAVVRTRAGITTYEATDDNAVTCAVTIYDGTCFASGLSLERSLRELRQLQTVNSPRVIKVHAAGKHGDGVFEVTDSLPGHTLAEQIGQGPLSMTDTSTLIVQVGEALLEAQRVGVIHRNLGADVVYPTAQGARVTGFAVGEPQSRGAGPLNTMAPEQVQGKVVDQRTLIYNVAALMQWVLTGAPLFSGSPDDVLAAHEGQMPSEDIDAKLRRALGKDPRMRPMMLKQFLHDIAELGGVQPPKLAARTAAPSAASPRAPIAAPKQDKKEGARPSSRGWTMFMTAQDGGEKKEEKPAPEAKPAGKPSTRGWTMFMEAQGDEAEKPKQEEAKPAGKPSTRGWTMFMEADEADEKGGEGDKDASQEAPRDADAPDPATPSTRGWTMFTKDEDEEEEKKEILAAAPPAATPPAAAATVTPPVAAPTAPADPPPAAAPPAAAPPAAAPPATGDAGEPHKPSTRGWTMFTKDEDEEAEKKEILAAAPPAADAALPAPSAKPEAPPAATPPEAAQADADAATPTEKTSSGPAKSPSSRGWTMFMEPVKGAKPADSTQDAQTPAPEPAPAPQEPAAPESAAAESGDDADAEPEAASSLPPGKKRGWTMFMNAPIEKLPTPDGGESKDDAPAQAEAATESADKKGWTVFGEPGSAAAAKKQEQAEALAKGPPTPVGGLPAAATPEPEAPPAPASGPSPAAGSGPVAAPSPAATTPSGPVIAPPGPADSGAGRGQTLLASDAAAASSASIPGDPIVSPSAKTVVNTGPPAGGPQPADLANPSSRGQTLLSGQAGGLPDTMYFRKGEVEPQANEPTGSPELSPRAPTVRDVRPTPMPSPAEERSGLAPTSQASPVAPSPAELQPVKSSNTALYVVAGVVAIVAMIAAYFAFA